MGLFVSTDDGSVHTLNCRGKLLHASRTAFCTGGCRNITFSPLNHKQDKNRRGKNGPKDRRNAPIKYLEEKLKSLRQRNGTVEVGLSRPREAASLALEYFPNPAKSTLYGIQQQAIISESRCEPRATHTPNYVDQSVYDKDSFLEKWFTGCISSSVPHATAPSSPGEYFVVAGSCASGAAVQSIPPMYMQQRQPRVLPYVSHDTEKHRTPPFQGQTHEPSPSSAPILSFSLETLPLHVQEKICFYLDYQSLIYLSTMNRHLNQVVQPQRMADVKDKIGFVMRAVSQFKQHFPSQRDGFDSPGNFECYICFRVREPCQFNAAQSQVDRHSSLRRFCIDCGLQHGLYVPFDTLSTYTGVQLWVCKCRIVWGKTKLLKCPSCGSICPLSSSGGDSGRRVGDYSGRERDFADTLDIQIQAEDA